MKQPAKRVMTMSPFLVVQILTRARSLERAGYKVIHMEAGEPNLPLPLPVQEALRQAASQPMGYTEAGGMLALRERIAAFYANQFGVTVDARRIFLTTGVSSALLMLLASIADSGEKVLIPDPGYPCYRQLLNFLGIIPEVLPLAAKRGYLPDIAQSNRLVQQAKALILASPANPTGVIMPSNRLGEILAICQAMDLLSSWMKFTRL